MIRENENESWGAGSGVPPGRGAVCSGYPALETPGYFRRPSGASEPRREGRYRSRKRSRFSGAGRMQVSERPKMR